MTLRIGVLTLGGVLAVLGASWGIYAARVADEEERIARQTASLVADAAGTLRRDLEGAVLDLRLLSGFQSLRQGVGAAAREDFAAFARSRPGYFQVRHLDAKGREDIRFDWTAEGPVPAAVLQDKSDRYYVRDLSRLPPDATYVSPLDWNVEFGRVEEPRRPTLRFGGRAPGGFVLLNADASTVLRVLREASAAFRGRLLLRDASSGGVLVEAQDGGWTFLPGAPLAAGADDLTRRSSVDFGGLSWALEGHVPRPVALAQARAGFRLHLAATAVLVVLMLAGGGLALRYARRAAELRAALRHAGEIEDVNRDLRRTRELLVERTRLATVGEMVPTLAHEIRNPLQAMLTAARSLRDDIRHPEGLRLLDLLTGEIVRLEETLRDLLPGEAGGREEPCDLGLAVRHVVDLLEAGRVERPGGAFELDLPRSPVFVRVVPRQLKQVLWNLALNAAEAAGTAGSAWIRVSREGKEGVLEIEDDGPGLAAPKPAGSGIGLTLCDAYVKRHGGRMALDPSPRGGARVRVVLPATVPQEVLP